MVKEPVNGTDGKPLKVPKKEVGFLYFVDSDGSVMRAKMSGNAPLSEAEIKRREKEKKERHEKYVNRVMRNKEKRIAAQKAKEEARAARLASVIAKREAELAAYKKRFNA